MSAFATSTQRESQNITRTRGNKSVNRKNQIPQVKTQKQCTIVLSAKHRGASLNVGKTNANKRVAGVLNAFSPKKKRKKKKKKKRHASTLCCCSVCAHNIIIYAYYIIIIRVFPDLTSDTNARNANTRQLLSYGRTDWKNIRDQ